MRQPIYDIQKSYLENVRQGPCFTEELPERTLPPKRDWIDFLGFKVASPLGVPAGPLLDSSWVSLAAKLGFDVVTYKTIRSQEHPAHPVPNMVYLNATGQLSINGEPLEWSLKPCTSQKELSLTNSFGMPSLGQDFLLQDIAKAKASLFAGQVMIVSVAGTAREGQDFENDFVKAALLACEGGADIIEANFSCPNVLSHEGSIYSSPETVYRLASALKKAVGQVPLIIKVGAFEHKKLLNQVLEAAARAGVEGVCGINTLKRELLPPLGPGRTSAGVCGSAIRGAALQFTKNAHEVIEREKLGLTLLATGGVTDPKHFDPLLQAGALIAMSAVGMMWDPYLASKYHHKEMQHA